MARSRASASTSSRSTRSCPSSSGSPATPTPGSRTRRRPPTWSAATGTSSRRPWFATVGSASMSRVYSNFVHVLAPGEAPESAAPRFRTFSGMDLDYWQSFYLLGEAEPLAERIRGKIEALGGVDEVILNPLDWDVEALERLADRGPAAHRRGIGRRRCPATSRRPGSTTPSRSFVRGRESSSPAPPTTTPPVSVARGTRTSSMCRA